MTLQFRDSPYDIRDLSAGLARLYPGNRPPLIVENGRYAIDAENPPSHDQVMAAVEAHLSAAPRRQALALLAGTDAKMARIAEDAIDALKAKGLIADADLPASAREIIVARKAARSQLAAGGGA